MTVIMIATQRLTDSDLMLAFEHNVAQTKNIIAATRYLNVAPKSYKTTENN